MRYGSGGRHTLVCVHGAGGGGWEWAVWARVLAPEGVQVVARDLLPRRDVAATRFDDYRAQVREWCEDARRERPDAPLVLVGASLGGLLALCAAADARANALVLVNPLPPGGLPGREPSPPVLRWRSARSLRGTLRAMPDADDAARIHAYRRWRDESGAVVDAACAGVACAPPRCPVLVVASGADEDVPAGSSRALALELGAGLVHLDGASHLAPLIGRVAVDVALRVAQWLERPSDGDLTGL